MSLGYLVATTVCGVSLFVVELLKKRTPSLSVLAFTLLMFHPYFWYAPLYQMDCSFPMVTDAQVVFGVVVVMLAIRLLSPNPASPANPR